MHANAPLTPRGRLLLCERIVGVCLWLMRLSRWVCLDRRPIGGGTGSRLRVQQVWLIGRRVRFGRRVGQIPS